MNVIKYLFIFFFLMSCNDHEDSDVLIDSKKFDIVDTNYLIARYKSFNAAPRPSLIPLNMYTQESINELEAIFTEEQIQTRINKVNSQIKYFNDLPADHPKTSLFPLDKNADVFFSKAVPLAIQFIIDHIDHKKESGSIKQAILDLFDDTNILRNRLNRLLFTLKDNPNFHFKIINIDENNYGIISPDIPPGAFRFRGSIDENIPDFILLDNEEIKEFTNQAISFVKGFDNEHLYNIILHEIGHSVAFLSDETYHGKEKEESGNIKDINRYTIDNLKSSEVLNSDNYVTLIYISLLDLHQKGILDLTQF